MTFPNLYYKRTAAAAKACYICYKPTVTVLATIDTADFLYTCPIHLTDPGFATRAPDPEPESKKPSTSPEEIAKVKQEWEEKQRRKSNRVREKEGGQANGDEKEGKDGVHKDADGKEAEGGIKADDKQEKRHTPMSNTPPSEEPTSRPTHERYVLHRNIFSLRTADHRRRRQTAQTKALAPRLPGIPRGPGQLP